VRLGISARVEIVYYLYLQAHTRHDI
jgi:hypothetical protein